MRGVVAFDLGRAPGFGVVQAGKYFGVARVGFHRREYRFCIGVVVGCPGPGMRFSNSVGVGHVGDRAGDHRGVGIGVHHFCGGVGNRLGEHCCSLSLTFALFDLKGHDLAGVDVGDHIGFVALPDEFAWQIGNVPAPCRVRMIGHDNRGRFHLRLSARCGPGWVAAQCFCGAVECARGRGMFATVSCQSADRVGGQAFCPPVVE